MHARFSLQIAFRIDDKMRNGSFDVLMRCRFSRRFFISVSDTFINSGSSQDKGVNS